MCCDADGEHRYTRPAASAPVRSPELGRRDVLRMSAAGSAAVFAPAALAATATADEPPAASGATGGSGLELVLLGTGAGPALKDRLGMSTALVVDGAVYVIDAGRGATTQFQRAGLDRSALATMFITHLHSDHLMSYYDFFLTNTKGSATVTTVYGPGPAGALPPEEDGSTPGIVNVADPTPGLAQFTEDLHGAFAYSSNALMRDTGSANPRDLVDAVEIGLPPVGASALGDTAPRMSPFTVMEDDRVKVSATLVAHGPVFPAFAFRFDTDHGSVTFSGDTRPHPNLVEIARDTDIFVLEAMDDAAMVGDKIAARHQRSSHVPLSRAGGIATRAGARQLVMSHIGPATGGTIDDAVWTATIARDYDGPVTIGSDLLRVTPAAVTGS